MNCIIDVMLSKKAREAVELKCNKALFC